MADARCLRLATLIGVLLLRCGELYIFWSRRNASAFADLRSTTFAAMQVCWRQIRMDLGAAYRSPVLESFLTYLSLCSKKRTAWAYSYEPQTSMETVYPLRPSIRPSLTCTVIAWPSFVELTDFDSLLAEPSVSLLFCRSSGGYRTGRCRHPSCQEAADVYDFACGGVYQTWIPHTAFVLVRPVVGIAAGWHSFKEISDPLGIEL